MIAAVIGEELGLVGIGGLVGLFGLFGYAGFEIAQRARDRYGKLLAAGLTSLVLVQAIVNLFAVLGLAPLTGRAAAVRLLRQLEPAGDAGRRSGCCSTSHAGAAPAARASRRAPVRDCASSTAGARGERRASAREEARASRSRPRVVIAAGGTAGHVVPALAVADALRDEGAEVSFLGAAERAEAEAGPGGRLRDRPPARPRPRPRATRCAAAGAAAARGGRGARRRAGVLRRREAEVVMGGGGYVAGPAGLAALVRCACRWC